MLRTAALCLAVACLTIAGPAVAGSSNTLYLTQMTDPGAFDGNSFISDQSAANATTIGLPGAAILQNGHGNVANVTITNTCPVDSLTCSTVSLTQDNSAALSAGLQSALPLDPNTARIVITGVGAGAVTQQGGGNQASLAIWDGGQGAITQSGLGNSATLKLMGSGNNSSINQSGPNNVADLTVTATALGAGVHLTQLGNDSTTATVTTNVAVSYTHFVP